MALQKSTIFKGVALPTAYFKVWRFDGDKEQLTISVGLYSQREAELIASTNYVMPYTLAGSDPIKQAYEYLKTLPDFEGAVDVLEPGQTA